MQECSRLAPEAAGANAAPTAIANITRRLPMAQDQENGARRLVQAFLARRSPATRRAYQADLSDFATFLELSNPADAVRHITSRQPGEANELALTYKGAMLSCSLSAATVNRRLSTLRSVVKMARMVGLCTFAVEVEAERTESYRDTRGPGVSRIKGLLAKLEAKADTGNRQAVRDLAIVRLLWNRGLRRGEAVSLDVDHYDRENKRLHVKAKARSSREWITISPAAVEALDRWLGVRGTHPGPLFVQLDRLARFRPGDGRLSATAVWRMLRRFDIRPHGLRHSAITEVLRLSNGDIPRTMRFSRHKSPAVVMIYDDRRTDDGGRLAAMLDDLA